MQHSIPSEHHQLFNSDVRDVCALFAAGQTVDVQAALVKSCQSPLQVPFYYLHFLHASRIKLGDDSQVTLSTAQVELAYRAILQRAPEDSASVQVHRDNCQNVEQLLARLLTCQEAVDRMPELHARAFPNNHRVWHVHIPKTAGSSFCTAAWRSGWGVVNTNALASAGGDLLEVAGAVRLGVRADRPILITGHWRLPRYLPLIGPFDRVVSFTRDPLECCVSEFNFLVDVHHKRPNVHKADTAPFVARGFDPESFERTFERGFFRSNRQCSYLADDSRCASALRLLESCRTELLPSTATSSAIARYFPETQAKQVNVSTKTIRSSDLSEALREQIYVSNAEDFMLNHVAERRHASFALTQGRGARDVSAKAA